MDSISGKRTETIAFEFSELSTDRPTLVEPWEVYLGIVGTFKVVSADKIIFSEQMFTVLELAVEMRLWQEYDKRLNVDFIYRSMETDEIGLVWVKRQADDGWVVGSTQNPVRSGVLTDVELDRAILSFYSGLRRAVRREFDINIDETLAWRREDSRGGPRSLLD